MDVDLPTLSAGFNAPGGAKHRHPKDTELEAPNRASAAPY
jgi:hypothetical protein